QRAASNWWDADPVWYGEQSLGAGPAPGESRRGDGVARRCSGPRRIRRIRAMCKYLAALVVALGLATAGRADEMDRDRAGRPAAPRRAAGAGARGGATPPRGAAPRGPHQGGVPPPVLGLRWRLGLVSPVLPAALLGPVATALVVPTSRAVLIVLRPVPRSR